MVFLYILCVIFLGFMYFITPMTFDKNIMLYILLLVVIMVIIFFILNKKELKRNYFKHSTLFVIGYIVVHFQKFIDYSMGLSVFESKFFINEKILCKSACISALGLASFFVGYFIYQYNEEKVESNENPSLLIYSSKLFVILSAIFLGLFFLTVNPLYLLGYYGEEKMGIGGHFFSVLMLLIFCVFAINLWNLKQSNSQLNLYQYIKSYGWIFNIVLLIFLIAVFFSGDRGPILINLLLYIGGYFFVCRKQIGIVWFFLTFIFAAFLFSLLGSARFYSKDIAYIKRIVLASENNNTLQERTIFPLTSELAGSIKCMNLAVNYIEETGDYKFGHFQTQYLLTTIPGYFTLWKQFNQEYLQTGSMKDFSSSDFLTYLEEGAQPRSGVGTSCVADLYLDFGIIGVVFGLFFFGALMKKCENDLLMKDNVSVFSFILSLMFFSYSFYIPRGTILMAFQMTVIIYILVQLKVYLHRVFN